MWGVLEEIYAHSVPDTMPQTKKPFRINLKGYKKDT